MITTVIFDMDGTVLNTLDDLAASVNHVLTGFGMPTHLPLSANGKENEFKVYVNDTGLLMARYGMQTKLAVLTGKIMGNAKGGIYENLISEMLVKRGYTLNYYKTGDSTMEIEFIIERNGGVVPVEVKAGNTSTPSLNRFIEQFRPSEAYKLIDGNIGTTGEKVTLPHYMAMFL